MPTADPVPLLTRCPGTLLCAGCREPAEASVEDRVAGRQVAVRCDCGRTSFYNIGDYVRTSEGVWHEIAPTIREA